MRLYLRIVKPQKLQSKKQRRHLHNVNTNKSIQKKHVYTFNISLLYEYGVVHT